MEKKRVLLGSPVHQSPAILNEFLTSLEEMEQVSISIDYMFVDDKGATVRQDCDRGRFSIVALRP